MLIHLCLLRHDYVLPLIQILQNFRKKNDTTLDTFITETQHHVDIINLIENKENID